MSIPLHEWLATISNREFEVRYEWLQQQWNKPTRSDYYRMLIVKSLAGRKSSKLSDFKLEFTDPEPKSTALSKQEIMNKAAIAKAAWAMRLTSTKGKRPPKDKT